jgi:hypothetical protein
MRIDYELQVEAEFHIGAGLSRPGVADELMVIRPDGRLVIPAEHLRGLLRDACTQILLWTGKAKDCCKASLQKAPTETEGQGVLKTCGLNFRLEQPCVLCRLFGTTFTPKAYHFSDAELVGEPNRRISTHNRIDPFTGRVPMDFLFSFEVGAPAVFRGYIERKGKASNVAELLEEVSLLVAGLRLIERVGKRSARGWGWCQVKSITLTGMQETWELVLEAYLKGEGKEKPEGGVGEGS